MSEKKQEQTEYTLHHIREINSLFTVDWNCQGRHGDCCTSGDP